MNEKDEALKYIDELKKVINRQEAEIEQWKEEANRYQKLWCEDVSTARAEAVKEFAELITADYPEMEYYVNDLAKEMTEDEGK